MAIVTATHTTYPAETDLIALLQQCGMPALMDAPSYQALSGAAASCCQAAVDDWENQTDWHPFLAGTPGETRWYDPSGPERDHTTRVWGSLGGSRIIEIDGGLLTLTSVTTGIWYDTTGTAQLGQARTLNFDFSLQPYDAPNLKRPYEYLEFFVPVYGTRRSVEVVGTFGYATTLPENVWRAILGRAMMEMQAQSALMITQGQVGLKIGTTIDVKFDSGALLKQWDPWRREYMRLVRQYRREDMGF